MELTKILRGRFQCSGCSSSSGMNRTSPVQRPSLRALSGGHAGGAMRFSPVLRTAGLDQKSARRCVRRSSFGTLRKRANSPGSGSRWHPSIRFCFYRSCFPVNIPQRIPQAHAQKTTHPVNPCFVYSNRATPANSVPKAKSKLLDVFIRSSGGAPSPASV